MISRRGFLATAWALTTVSGAAGAGLSLRPAAAFDTGGGPAPAHGLPDVSVADLRETRGPVPEGRLRRFDLTAAAAEVPLSSGRKIPVWAFNGRVPGPPVTAEEGDLIEVVLRNTDITEGVTLHWHGYDVPCGEDGVPGLTQEAVTPGGEFTYRFRADQVGTYWYHTHSVSDIGVRRGLYGALIVTPRTARTGHEDELDLPVLLHTFDGATVLNTGDTAERHAVRPGTQVRLRAVNTDSRPHRLALPGTAFRVAAVDGRDLSGPGEVSGAALRLPAGGRCDLVFAMPETPVSLLVGDTETGGLHLDPRGADPQSGPQPPTAADRPELDLLDYGTPAPTPFDAHDAFDRDFTLVLDRGPALKDGIPHLAHTVNGRARPAIPSQLVAAGDLVRFTVVNRSRQTHPWHLHGHPVLVLSRDGRAPAGSPLWHDTFDVRPGEVWQVAFRADNPGLWMNHCHDLSHAEDGMMLHLHYEGVGSPFHGHH